MKSYNLKIIGLVCLVVVVVTVCPNFTSGRIVRQEVSSASEAIGYATSFVERVVKDAIRIAAEPLPEEYVKIIRWQFLHIILP